MLYYGQMWPAVELRELRVFFVLAEERHFSHAAERLHITPSRVSQTIADLEAKAGGKLFDRTSRRVRITPLGATLDAQLRPLYEQMQAAFESATEDAKGARGTLRIGVTINTDRPSVDRLIARFEEKYPDCRLSLAEVDVWDPYEPLRNGTIDVLCNWLAVEEPDLTAGPVIEQCERVLVVGSSHRLAQAASATTDELVGESVNQPPRRFPRALADTILPRTSTHGHPIERTDEELESIPEVVARIARGEIVSINVSGTFRFARDKIVLVPLTDLPPLPLGLIWCTAHENGRIRALAELVEETG
jgi:DNA-binding transcriptional LysR family regulator